MENRAPHPKLVVLLSGGMDSATLVGMYSETFDIHPISFDYGQKHVKETECAYDLCEHYGLKQKLVDISFYKHIANSALTHALTPVPEGKYDEKVMMSTVKPNRNMILLAIAAAYSIDIGAYRIAYAAHSGDHAIYPDCRPEFIGAMTNVLRLCHYEPVTLYTPFNGMSKADVLRTGLGFNVPYELTWSCYKGGEVACGKCGTCYERLEAFDECGIDDPIDYEDRTWWKEHECPNTPQ